MPRVLVVDPNAADRDWLDQQFSAANYETVAFANGDDAIRELERADAALVVTEWLLPDITGLELTERIRRAERPDTRVVMVSTRSDPGDIARALEAGVDDFVIKPPRSTELLARAQAALRRPALPPSNGVLRVGSITLDPSAHKVSVNNHELSLAPVEFRLIAYFMENAGRVIGRQQLLDKVWNRRSGIGERTVDVHVRRLRAALEPHGCEAAIQTVRGFGYRFE